jgi:hypothetical protein
MDSGPKHASYLTWQVPQSPASTTEIWSSISEVFGQVRWDHGCGRADEILVLTAGGRLHQLSTWCQSVNRWHLVCKICTKVSLSQRYSSRAERHALCVPSLPLLPQEPLDRVLDSRVLRPISAGLSAVVVIYTVLMLVARVRGDTNQAGSSFPEESSGFQVASQRFSQGSGEAACMSDADFASNQAMPSCRWACLEISSFNRNLCVRLL